VRSTAVCGEGGADRAVPRHNEGERARGEMTHRTDKTVPRGRDREGGARARATGADTPTPQGRGRESARGKETPLTHGAHLSGGAGARAWPRWARLARFGLKWVFFFPGNFYCLLFLFSLGFSIQIQTKFQIQTKSNMCINSKSILGSA
jgi:hypothetical protein